MNDTGWDNARAKGRAQIGVCSFDVFDTFLLRRCTTPDGVFERAFELSPVSRSHPHAVATYVQHRIHAEARARRAAKDKHGTMEVGIDDIYAYFPYRLFGLDRSALASLVDAEFEAEIDLCRINHEMLHLYREAKRHGRRVGFISDTYWNEQQLSRLLRAGCPDLTWDFLYASCAHGTSKSDKLFARYLAEQEIDPSTAMHVGDNEAADIKGARRHGIKARFYPQASAAFTAQLLRESATFELLCQHDISRLDHGLRTLRRIVAAQTPERSAAFHLGVTTLGPAMVAFDAFIAARLARLQRAGAKTAVAFLGRDGFLPHRVWQDLHGATASYVEINRRVSLIGSAVTIDPLIDLFTKINRIDAVTFGDIVKILPPAVITFFSRFPDGIATGPDLAKALPQLIDPSQITDVAAAMRKALLTYLRQTIPDFDDCTDLVLADLGYSGSVQKALRCIFDHEGIRVRIHGTYLMTLDDAFDDLASDDTAEGLISDLVVTPHVKRMLIRNIALLEQICCSADGSVRDYRRGEVLREINPRPPSQLALAAEIQSGTLAFVTCAQELAPQYGLQPFANSDVAARWTAAILGRLLLLPTDDELVLLGEMKHDVNLGTQALAPMLDSRFIRNAIIARGFPSACVANAPPMWLAGSFAEVSPSHGYLYVLFGANRLPANVFGEAKCGTLQIGLFGANGEATMQTIACYRTGFGDMRLRIPVTRQMKLATIAVPLARLATTGLLHGVTVQTGETVKDATMNPDIIGLPEAKLTTAGLDLSGRHYRASNEGGCLLIAVDPPADQVAIYSVGFTSLSEDRILALQDAATAGDELAAALLPRIADGAGSERARQTETGQRRPVPAL